MTARFLLVTIRPELDAARDEYESMLAATGLPASALSQHLLADDPLDDALDGVAGVIVGGSPYSVTDAAKTSSQRRAESDLRTIAAASVGHGLPVLFTCYGIGVVAQAYGGSVGREYGEPTSAVPVTLTAAGIADPLLGALPATFDALVAHKEAVNTLPTGAVLLAGSPSCPVQAFRLGTHLYAVQFHPEVTADDLAARAGIYQHHGYFDAHELHVVQARLAETSVTVPRRLLKAFVDLHC
ncbi:glutamine amidotransferase [Leifsonia sp. YIM 134122]|uniref:Glutamine amidotransferase n=1 Tax=Leifsonia stereocauli TaxID=3134136 RepID=A0ABU9W7U2_9MICO